MSGGNPALELVSEINIKDEGSPISEKLYISLPDTCLYNEEENRKGKNVLFSKKLSLFETAHSFETVTVDGGEFRGTCRKNSSYFD